MAATIGFEFFPFIVKYKNKTLKLEIWDTCGQEAYRSLIKTFFNNSSLAIIVYAIDSRKSFDSIEEWIRQCKTLCSPDTKFFLIGNKSDVEDEK
jgi:small GTP-binding protein